MMNGCGDYNFSSRPGQRCYIAIDLKSFYASIECVERGLDPLDSNLVVADLSRTEKTICLAVSPSLKMYGCGGRPRLFELIGKINIVNAERRQKAGLSGFTGKSISSTELSSNPGLAVDYIVACPRMALYLEYSRRICDIYRSYVADEDIHIYSVDEVFIDVTTYLDVYGLSAHDLAMNIIRNVLHQTGVTATAGIGPNLYLCKVAMDIVAKKMQPDENGVRIAELDVRSYRQQLWNHRPITDFWRIGKGIARRLKPYGICTMGDIARCSLENEDFLYDMFGVNAELIMDHAWGQEPVTMDMIRSYRPNTRSMGSGQVLSHGYSVEHARNVIMEMTESLALDLFANGVVSRQLTVDIGYDVNCGVRSHGCVNLPYAVASASIMTEAVAGLYDRIVDRTRLIKRLNVTASNILSGNFCDSYLNDAVQLDLFADYEKECIRRQRQKDMAGKEMRLQSAMLEIRKNFGKNAILKGLNYAEGTTQRERNNQIGGHKA